MSNLESAKMKTGDRQSNASPDCVGNSRAYVASARSGDGISTWHVLSRNNEPNGTNSNAICLVEIPSLWLLVAAAQN